MLFIAEEVRQLLASLGLRIARRGDRSGRAAAPAAHRRRAGRHARPVAAARRRPTTPKRRGASSRSVPIQRPRSALDERLLADGFRRAVGRRRRRARLRDHQRRSHGRRVARRRDRPRVGRGACRRARSHARFTGSAGPELRCVPRRRRRPSSWSARPTTTSARAWAAVASSCAHPPTTPGDPVLAGNTVLYGATGGQVFVAGRVGERFCVRNSGATAVVEGTGDHCVRVHDRRHRRDPRPGRLQPRRGDDRRRGLRLRPRRVARHAGSTVSSSTRRSPTTSSRAELRFLVERHRELTGSAAWRRMLADWDATVRCFWRVAPVDEVARIERGNEGRLGAQL